MGRGFCQDGNRNLDTAPESKDDHNFAIEVTYSSFQNKFAKKIKLGKMSSSEALKCLNWLPLAGRRLSHRCTAVENAIKGDIPQHFESFKSTLRSSHGYNTRHGYLPRLPKPKTECGKRVSYFRFTNDWMSLPVFLRKPMPCTIFKKNIE